MADMQSLVDGLVSLDEEGLVTVITSALHARPEVAPSVVNFAVPDLTYPPQRALAERRCTGNIKSFNEVKGFGFIACEEISSAFGGDVFLHASQMPAWVEQGMTVNFAIMLSPDHKPQAYDLQPQGAAKGAAKGAKGGGGKLGPKGGAGGWGGGDWGADAAQKGNAGAAKGGKGWEKGGGQGWGDDGWGTEQAWPQKGGWGEKGWGEKGWNLAGPAKGKGKGKDGNTGFKRPGKSLDDVEIQGNFGGIIKSFSEKTGYGFIECADTKLQYGSDVFLHHAQIGEFKVGDNVDFNVFLNQQGKPQAKDLTESLTGEMGPSKRAKIEDFDMAGWDAAADGSL